MAITLLMLEYLLGFEILIKYKEAIRQLVNYIGIDILTIMERYKLGYSLVCRVFNYEALKRVRFTRIGRFRLLNDL